MIETILEVIELEPQRATAELAVPDPDPDEARLAIATHCVFAQLPSSGEGAARETPRG